MRRREFVKAIAGSAWPLATRAQLRKFELGRLQHRQIGWLLAFEYATHVGSGLTIKFNNARAITHERTGGDCIPVSRGRCQLIVQT